MGINHLVNPMSTPDHIYERLDSLYLAIHSAEHVLVFRHKDGINRIIDLRRLTSTRAYFERGFWAYQEGVELCLDDSELPVIRLPMPTGEQLQWLPRLRAFSV